MHALEVTARQRGVTVAEAYPELLAPGLTAASTEMPPSGMHTRPVRPVLRRRP